MHKKLPLLLSLIVLASQCPATLAQAQASYGGDDAPQSRPSKYSSAADDDYLGSPPPRSNTGGNRPTYNDSADSGTGSSSQPTVNSTKIIAPTYVTYWSHDGLGYHPAIAVNLQNDSGQNLVGQIIQMQAQFLIVAEGITSISRWQTSFNLIGGIQQVNSGTRCKRPFELSIDPGEWPIVECKVLCKVANNPGQTVLISKIDPVTMNDDEARAQLNNRVSTYRLNKYKMDAQNKKDAQKVRTDKPDRSPRELASVTPPPRPKPLPRVETPPPVEKPLSAVAASFSNPIASGASPSTASTREVPGASAVEAFIGKSSNQPGLSDDFYMFEKLYGLPVQTDVKDKNWVWAEYRKAPGTRILAGSKGRTGKADTILVVIKQDNLNDTQIVNCVKAIAGRFKSEKLSALEHSVRYVDSSIIASGRLELAQITGQSFRGLAFKLRESDGSRSTAVVVSRLPGSLAEQLKTEAHATDLLNFLLTSLGESDTRGSQSRATSKDGDDDY